MKLKLILLIVVIITLLVYSTAFTSPPISPSFTKQTYNYRCVIGNQKVEVIKTVDDYVVKVGDKEFRPTKVNRQYQFEKIAVTCKPFDVLEIYTGSERISIEVRAKLPKIQTVSGERGFGENRYVAYYKYIQKSAHVYVIHQDVEIGQKPNLFDSVTPCSLKEVKKCEH